MAPHLWADSPQLSEEARPSVKHGLGMTVAVELIRFIRLPAISQYEVLRCAKINGVGGR